MCRHAEVLNAPANRVPAPKCLQDLKSNHRRREEVRRNHVPDVLVRKRPPGLGPRFPMPNHVLCDCGRGDLDTQLQQLSLDRQCTPTRVVSADHPDQIPDLSGLGMISFSLQRAQAHLIQTQKTQSAFVSRIRFRADRRRTAICCRKARFSSRSSAKARPHVPRAANGPVSAGRSSTIIATRSHFLQAHLPAATECPFALRTLVLATRSLHAEVQFRAWGPFCPMGKCAPPPEEVPGPANSVSGRRRSDGRPGGPVHPWPPVRRAAALPLLESPQQFP